MSDSAKGIGRKLGEEESTVQPMMLKTAERALCGAHSESRAAAEPGPLYREELGRQLRTERRSRRQRMTDLAQRAGVSQQYISEVERGKKDPSPEILHALTGALGMEVPEMLRHVARRMEGEVSVLAFGLAA